MFLMGIFNAFLMVFKGLLTTLHAVVIINVLSKPIKKSKFV